MISVINISLRVIRPNRNMRIVGFSRSSKVMMADTSSRIVTKHCLLIDSDLTTLVRFAVSGTRSWSGVNPHM